MDHLSEQEKEKKEAESGAVAVSVQPKSYSRFSDEERGKIRRWADAGYSHNSIGKLLGRAQSAVSSYLRSVAPAYQERANVLELFKATRADLFANFTRLAIERATYAVESMSRADINGLKPTEKGRIVRDLVLGVGVMQDKEALERSEKQVKDNSLVISVNIALDRHKAVQVTPQDVVVDVEKA